MADTPPALPPLPMIRPFPPPEAVTAGLNALKASCADWPMVTATNGVQSADDTEEAFACSVSPSTGAEIYYVLYAGVGLGVILAIVGWLVARSLWQIGRTILDVVAARRGEAV